MEITSESFFLFLFVLRTVSASEITMIQKVPLTADRFTLQTGEKREFRTALLKNTANFGDLPGKFESSSKFEDLEDGEFAEVFAVPERDLKVFRLFPEKKSTQSSGLKRMVMQTGYTNPETVRKIMIFGSRAKK